MNQVIPGQQTLTALVGAQRPPVHKRRFCGIHSGGDLLSFQQRDMANGFIGGGVINRFFATALPVDSLTVHVGVLPEQTRIFQALGERGR
ncbi:hypothetical protein HORIV_52410 [Vreelandella olivaria]|uniref:Uncharacterized protein n=1 Tax=Vreelandella olivaria TaxID=390919 RepID=A0ABN5X6U7_9GAMM|nr:hypothetical protein HORIV_52410 [Halomonas olivaria]